MKFFGGIQITEELLIQKIFGLVTACPNEVSCKTDLTYYLGLL